MFRCVEDHTFVFLSCGRVCCLTWWAHRSLPVVGWMVSQSFPTVMLQLTQQMLPHTTEHWLIIIKCEVTYLKIWRGLKKKNATLQPHTYGTFILSTESVIALAWWMRWVCSMYSVSRWRKLRGSLNTTGMAIFDNSWKRCWRRWQILQGYRSVDKVETCNSSQTGAKWGLRSHISLSLYPHSLSFIVFIQPINISFASFPNCNFPAWD